MTGFAVDTGPLVALLNARDSFHAWAKETLGSIAPPLQTCESVISEACFLVRHLRGGPDAVLALACLVRMTEVDRDLTIITLDKDFRVYRRQGRQAVPVLMP